MIIRILWDVEELMFLINILLSDAWMAFFGDTKFDSRIIVILVNLFTNINEGLYGLSILI